ncbi:MAG TPA: hypothetical protein VN673_08060 [Clostridia bacterium]|nr:hypothetical protein [Clostridia bacterium]
MQTAELKTLQSRPQDLAGLYRALARLLGEAGLTSAQLSEVFAHHVHARCTVCDMKFTGEELGCWAVLAPDAKPADSRLDRLRLGYCGREKCQSWSYQLEVSDYPGLDWTKVLGQVDLASLAATAPAKRPSFVSMLPRLETRTWVRLSVGLLIVASLLLIRHRQNGGRIPLLQPKHHYMLQPASDGQPGKP